MNTLEILDKEDSDKFDDDEALGDEIDNLTGLGELFYPFSEGNFLLCEEKLADQAEAFKTYRELLASNPAEAGQFKAEFCNAFMRKAAEAYLRRRK
jgi:hypothetical protein